MAAIGSQSVTVWTDAPEGSRNIVTSEGTLVTHFLTFVYIFTHLHGTRSKAISAIAFESSFHIRASTVPADIGNSAFVIVYLIKIGFLREYS